MEKINWNEIDTVLLDMDGTLLDKDHDDYFWQILLPKAYAKKNKITLKEAEEQLKKKYKKQEGTSNWGDVYFWEKTLGLELWEMKYQVKHLARLHPHTMRFLKFLKKNNKKIYLVTAADLKDVDLKLGDKGIIKLFDGIYSQAVIKDAKESISFWKSLEKMVGYDAKRTIFVDDCEPMLKAAKDSGIRWLVFKSKSSSKRAAVNSNNFINVHHFDDIID